MNAIKLHAKLQSVAYNFNESKQVYKVWLELSFRERSKVDISVAESFDRCDLIVMGVLCVCASDVLWRIPYLNGLIAHETSYSVRQGVPFGRFMRKIASYLAFTKGIKVCLWNVISCPKPTKIPAKLTVWIPSKLKIKLISIRDFAIDKTKFGDQHTDRRYALVVVFQEYKLVFNVWKSEK